MPNPSHLVARPHIPPHDLVPDLAFPHFSTLPCALWKSCSCTLNLFKGTPVHLAWMEIWVTLKLPALLPLRSFRIPPQGGVACFSLPLNIFINPLLHFAVEVHRTKKIPVPAGIVYQWKTWPSPLPQGRLGSASLTKTPGSQPPSPLLPSFWGTLANTQHCNP